MNDEDLLAELEQRILTCHSKPASCENPFAESVTNGRSVQQEYRGQENRDQIGRDHFPVLHLPVVTF